MVAQQQIGLARTQVTAKQREQRLIRLTLGEMETLPTDAVVYEGVGKMYVFGLPCVANDQAHEDDHPHPRRLYNPPATAC